MTKRVIIESFESLGYIKKRNEECSFENKKEDKYIKVYVDDLEVKCMHLDQISAAKMNIKEIKLVYELLRCLRDDE